MKSRQLGNPYLRTPLYDLLHLFERAPDQWAARYILILSAIIMRAAVGLGSYSGQGQWPLHGDFEAQRHWMEITAHLPIREWYFFDLQYWGLDYPPLTAYHLWLFGKIGQVVNSDWFALGASRGVEGAGVKTFMRLSSLLSELVFFVPATLQLTALLGQQRRLSRMHLITVLVVILFQPPLVLVDHGHFQYNSVMLGLFVFSVIELIKGNYVLGLVWMISAMAFKQMALYYAPFVFCYILANLCPGSIREFMFGRFLAVGTSVVLTLAAVLLPFYWGASSASEAAGLVKQILVRVFPFERGLFEDKVANFWCTTNLMIKYKSLFSNEQLKLMALALTLALVLPPCLLVFWKSRKPNNPLVLLYGFGATAWGFFLCLFQVHEKTVLVPLVPSTFLLLLGDANVIPIVQWINNVATFSLYPLLKRDGLTLQYFVLLFTINWLLLRRLLWPSALHFLLKAIVFLSYAAIVVLHVVEATIPPPSQYPDLWVIANCAVSFGCFGTFYVWLVARMKSL